MNGDTYNGTLFSSDPHDIMAMSDVKQIRYKDGILTSQGKTENG
jgi:small nuclear ribonucleoprotein (snRNP)-like protein